MRMREILAALEGVDSATIGRIQRGGQPAARASSTRRSSCSSSTARSAKIGGRWFRTPKPWEPDEERIARVTATRRAELAQMRAYVDHDGCRMEFLTRLLDDPAAAPCGRCANDVGQGMPRDVDPALVEAAVDFLRRDLPADRAAKRWVERDAVAEGVRPSSAAERARDRAVLLRRPGLGTRGPAVARRRRAVLRRAGRRRGPGDPRPVATGAGARVGDRRPVDAQRPP